MAIHPDGNVTHSRERFTQTRNARGVCLIMCHTDQKMSDYACRTVNQNRNRRTRRRGELSRQPDDAEVSDRRVGPSREKTVRRFTYTTPTSSFAGGRRGTQIFAAVSGGSDGASNNLLRAHHDAVVQPLSKRRTRPAARVASSSAGEETFVFNSSPQKLQVLSVHATVIPRRSLSKILVPGFGKYSST